jgi:hypothetical protein
MCLRNTEPPLLPNRLVGGLLCFLSVSNIFCPAELVDKQHCSDIFGIPIVGAIIITIVITAVPIMPPQSACLIFIVVIFFV